MTGGKHPTLNNRRASLAFLVLFLGTPALADEVVEETREQEGAERVPLHTIVPAYPEKARRARVEGEVEVCFNVDRDGKTQRVAVRRSSNRVFEKPAKRAVRDSTYQPLPDEVELSGIKTCRTFRFYLNPVAIDKPGD